jgi:hypothetical protein
MKGRSLPTAILPTTSIRSKLEVVAISEAMKPFSRMILHGIIICINNRYIRYINHYMKSKTILGDQMDLVFFRFFILIVFL